MKGRRLTQNKRGMNSSSVPPFGREVEGLHTAKEWSTRLLSASRGQGLSASKRTTPATSILLCVSTPRASPPERTFPIRSRALWSNAFAATPSLSSKRKATGFKIYSLQPVVVQMCVVLLILARSTQAQPPSSAKTAAPASQKPPATEGAVETTPYSDV